MKMYKLVNDEKIEMNSNDPIFESVNTHSGDEQEVLLAFEKTAETTVKNLLCQLTIVDNDETYNLKKNDSEDYSVFYYRTLTGKSLKFYIYYKKGEEFTQLKPDKNGIFHIEKNWSLDENVVIKLQLVCDEYFSETFGENKTIILGIRCLGEVNESKNFI